MGVITERRFPIMDTDGSRLRHRVTWDVPWALLAPHEAQAQINHGQSLERLAERGGLSPCEALAIIEDRRWRRMHEDEARGKLKMLAEPPPVFVESEVEEGRYAVLVERQPGETDFVSWGVWDDQATGDKHTARRIAKEHGGVVVHVLAEGALERAVEGAAREGERVGAERERKALLAYVTGWVREQFRGVERERLGPEDGYDDVKALIEKRSKQAREGVPFEALEVFGTEKRKATP